VRPELKAFNCGMVYACESALASLGYSTQNYNMLPIVVCPGLNFGERVIGYPILHGTKPKEILDSGVPGIGACDIPTALCDVIEYNKYAEDIMLALQDLREDVAMMKKIYAEAESRGIADLLEWELSEVDSYFNY